MELVLRSLCLLTCFCASLCDYWSDREHLINNENSQSLGSDIVLNEKEEIVNNYLMSIKVAEYDKGFNEPGKFLPSRHYFEARLDIEQSKVFNFIKKVPKGGALHGHDTALLSFERFYKFTYEKYLHSCVVNDKLQLKFLLNSNQDPLCMWELVEDLRADELFDTWLRSKLTLETSNPHETYGDIDKVWGVLNNIFEAVTPMIMYRPVLEKYFYESLKELYEDNVKYLEFRGTLDEVYELNGTIYTPTEIVGIYQDVAAAFQRDYPDFLGAKLIYAPVRLVNESTVEYYVDLVNQLKNTYPDFLVGFDLVGQEDKGRPLVDFINQIKNANSNIEFVFHAAETNWYGSSTDFNLFDAILLGTKRIGHGFGLTKHPLIMDLVRAKNIAVEVCPISNQVLKLIEDFRNHPAAILIGRGFPVVVGNDDPSYWGTKGLSYDFYMMFMGVASRNADLKFLKKLAENSLRYSLLLENEKQTAIAKWNNEWDQFINVMYTSIISKGDICIVTKL